MMAGMDKHQTAAAIVDELVAARAHLTEALETIELHGRGFADYAKKIAQEIERIKAIEWPLRGHHPDDPPRHG